MTSLLQSILDALSVGSMYALLALGLTLVFSVMNLINFAYGLLLVWTAYGVVLLADVGTPFWLIVPLAITLTTLLSLAMGYFAFRPFIGAPQTTLLITSFGVLLVTQYIAILIFGEAPKVLAVPDGINSVWHLGDLRIPALQVVTIGAAAVTVLGFYLLLNRTTYGAQLRAAAELPDVARLMGIRPNRVLMGAFAISGVIAGIVGLLWFAKIGVVTPRSDLEPTLKAFVALVLGGLGRPVGAIYGGLLLGAIEVAMSQLLPDSTIRYTAAIVFTLVIAMLLVRPQGIAGGKAVEA
jgi:branched-chain amino acid transport system permease protein